METAHSVWRGGQSTQNWRLPVVGVWPLVFRDRCLIHDVLCRPSRDCSALDVEDAVKGSKDLAKCLRSTPYRVEPWVPVVNARTYVAIMKLWRFAMCPTNRRANQCLP